MNDFSVIVKKLGQELPVELVNWAKENKDRFFSCMCFKDRLVIDAQQSVLNWFKDSIVKFDDVVLDFSYEDDWNATHFVYLTRNGKGLEVTDYVDAFSPNVGCDNCRVVPMDTGEVGEELCPSEPFMPSSRPPQTKDDWTEDEDFITQLERMGETD